MRVVEVFSTNVSEEAEANHLIGLLRKTFPDYKINFDLEDCDKILRIESDVVNSEEVIKLVHAERFHCEILN